MDPSGISFLFLSVFVFLLSHRANDETMGGTEMKTFFSDGTDIRNWPQDPGEGIKILLCM